MVIQFFIELSIGVYLDFCKRDSVLWDDWCMHFVNRLQLVCVLENDFDGRYSHYDLVVEAVRVVDDLCRSLNDFT